MSIPSAFSAIASLALAATVCLAPSIAVAHGALPTIYEVAESDGEIIGLGATFGVLLRTADGGFQYSCEDVVSTPVSGYVVRSPTDVVVATRRGIWRSEDAGCSYAPIDTAVGELPIAEVRTEAGVSYVSTASTSSPNTVFRSDDGGLTWTGVGPQLDGVALYGLAIAGDRIVVSGLSADTGWTVFDWSESEPEPIALLPEWTLDAEVWIVGESVWVADIIAAKSVLYEIVGGSAVARSGELDGVITDVAEENGRTLVATDTDMIFEVVNGQLEQIEGEVGTCFVTLEDGTRTRCGSPLGEYLVWTGLVGESEPLFRYDEIVPNPCVLEEGHPCEPIWVFAARLFGAIEEEPTAPAPKGGCVTAGGPGPGVPLVPLLVGAVLLAGRRRYSASQSSVSSRSARRD